MDPTLLGLVLDSSAVIVAERRKQPVTEMIEAILLAYGPLELSLSPVTVAELVHGIYRARSPEVANRSGLRPEDRAWLRSNRTHHLRDTSARHQRDPNFAICCTNISLKG